MSAHGHAPTITLEEATLPKDSILRKAPLLLAIVGIIGLALAYVTGGGDDGHHKQFYYSYVTSLMYWLSIALGGLFFVLCHHGSRAGWSTVVRRIAENFMITLPLFALLAVPLIIGMHDLFHWSHADAVANDKILQAKTWWLNSGGFIIRVIVVGVVWTIMSVTFYRWSTRQDEEGGDELSHKMRWAAPLGFLFFALSATVAAIDWMMSLDPHWYSTIFGVYYFASCVMMIMVAISLASMFLQRLGLLEKAITAEHYHDLGKLAFGFVVFWAYIGFSQYFLIWYANIPEETMWYAHRSTGGWEWVSLALAVFHFIVPFLFLMSRHIKRKKFTYAIGCLILAFAHYIDVFWIIQPTMEHFGHSHFSFHVADILAFVGIGGLFLAVFVWRTASKALVPIKDPRLAESLAHENF